jgi:hypothetical protein
MPSTQWWTNPLMTALQWWASNPEPYDYEPDTLTTARSYLGSWYTFTSMGHMCYPTGYTYWIKSSKWFWAFPWDMIQHNDWQGINRYNTLNPGLQLDFPKIASPLEHINIVYANNLYVCTRGDVSAHSRVHSSNIIPKRIDRAQIPRHHPWICFFGLGFVWWFYNNLFLSKWMNYVKYIVTGILPLYVTLSWFYHVLPPVWLGAGT